ncbi:MAG TPA: ABC transporter permease, partial [Acidobacteriota bacterium]|nr:ABC transporter permease [Acidobacteriota bacterium]
MSDDKSGILLRAYLRLVLLLYPPEFRRRHGDELQRLLGQDIRTAGLRQRWYLLWAGLADAVKGGLGLRFAGGPAGGARARRLKPSRRPIAHSHRPPLWGRASMFDQLQQDFAYAFRNLVRRPGWTLAAGATLALGIGATTVVFSLVNDVLLRPLPYPDSERLVQLRAYDPERQRLREVISYPLCQSIGEAQQALQDFGCYAVNTNTVELQSGARRLLTGVLTWQVLRAVGAEPLMGRLFNASDDQPDAPRAVLLSFGFWQEHFGGQREVLGQTMQIEGTPYTIVGVMPRGFVFPDYGPGLWVSMAGRPRTANINWLRTLGRLGPDWTHAQAWAHFDALRLEVPSRRAEGSVEVTVRPATLKETLVGEVRPQLWIFLAAVVAVLLIACINVANLLLSRMAGRTREMALRCALGAGRRRLLAQMLSETTLLGLLGGAAGLAAALLIGSVVHSMASDFVPRGHLLGLDGSAYFFAAVLSLTVGLLVGILPALRASRPDLNAGLRESARGSAGSLRHNRLRAGLVVAQIALAMVLLANAGLLLRSLQRLASTDLGYRSADLLTVRPSPPFARYRNPESMRSFYADLRQRLEGLPHLEAASATACVPMGGVHMQENAWPQGQDLEEPGESVDAQIVDPDFFRVLGVSSLRGRLLTAGDRPGAPPVVVVNETLARRFFGQDPALGSRLTVGRGQSQRELEIVGVVPDLQLYGLTSPIRPMIFEALAQRPEQSYPDMLVRAAPGRAADLSREIKNLVHSLDPGIPLVGQPALQDQLSGHMAEDRFRSLLLAAFGVTALLLAVIGVYGVMAYGVTRRTQEIGVRMALGARRGQILAWVIRRGLLLTAVGLALGLAGTLATSHLLESYLHQLSPHDQLTYASALTLLFIAALMATYLPARRASRT